jgi:4-amino-4-deoxychorismate lyase
LAVMQEKGLLCQVVHQDISDLFCAQELFVCNSLMMLVPVVSLFNPLTQQNKHYVIEQTKLMQYYIQHTINLKALKV